MRGTGAPGGPAPSSAGSLARDKNHLPAADGRGKGWGGARRKEGGGRGAAQRPAQWRTTGEGSEGRTEAGLRHAEEAAEETQKGRQRGEVRGAKGRGTVQRQGTTASRKEDRREGGSNEQRRAREVQGTEGRADRRGKVGMVPLVWGRGTEGGRRTGGARDRGRQGSQEQEATDRGRQGSQEEEARNKGRRVEEGICGHGYTRGRGEAGCGEVSSTVPSTTVPSSHAGVPPPQMYLGALPPAPMQQHWQAVRATCEAQGGKGKELRRAWKRVGEDERRLHERKARVMVEGQQGRSQGRRAAREAQRRRRLRSCSAHGRIFGGDWRRWTGQSGSMSGKANGRRGRGDRESPPTAASGQPVIPPGVDWGVAKRA